MNKIKSSKFDYFYLIIFLIFLSILFKVDYRYINELNCCGDDFDYYSHALTIAVDKDFDYSNQLTPNDASFFMDEKIAPLGFFGTGMLSAPFLFLGDLLDKALGQQRISNKVILYSLSSIFYLLLSIILIYSGLTKLKINENIYILFLFISGSGLAYYAFERYSMTHVYELFSISLIFYSVVNINILKDKKKHYFLLAFAIFAGISVRYTNYFLFILPYIFEKIYFKNNKKFKSFSSCYFIAFLSFFSLLFYFINAQIYGKFIVNPLNIYYADSYRVTNYLNEINNVFDFFTINIQILLKILFAQEFGIFWFSPIIFIGFVTSISFLKNKELNYLTRILVMIVFLYNFGIVAVWSSTASSYGFRYLFSLIPVSLIIFYSFKKNTLFNLMNKYLLAFSFFGLISIIFFESTKITELSTVSVINTFGKEDLYSNPTYLSGLISSILDGSAYVKIFASSFLLFLFYSLTKSFINLKSIIENLDFGVAASQKQKMIETLELYDEVSFVQVLIILLFILLFSYILTTKMKNNVIYKNY